MNISTPTSAGEIKEELSAYDITPRKALGQNFLVSAKTLQLIRETASVSPDETVVEVGPGIGTLTEALAEDASRVIAIEKDKRLGELLSAKFQGRTNVEIVVRDALSWELPEDVRDYLVVSNLPYYITSPLIRKFLEADRRPSRMVLMVQKEVAQRICASPPDMSQLAVSVQFYASPRIAATVPQSAFWPQPAVKSAILEIVPGERPTTDPSAFFRVVRAGFSSPRQQLQKTLAAQLGLPKEESARALELAGIDPSQRPETLSVAHWERLTAILSTV